MTSHRTGNALAFALIVLLIVTLLVSALLVSTGHSGSQAVQRIAKMQARQLAEAAIRLEAWKISTAAMDSTPLSFLNAPQGLDVPAVSVDSTDFWLRLQSTATFKGQNSTITAELGKPLNPEAFRYALRILDSMETGERASIRTQDSVIFGNGTGKITTTQVLDQLLKLPDVPATKFSGLLQSEFAPDSINHCEQGCLHGSQRYSDMDALNELPLLRVTSGDLHLNLVGAQVLHGSHQWAVQGDVEIDGDLTIDTLTILAEGPVQLKGKINAQRLVIFTKNKLDIEGDGNMEVRLYAMGTIRLAGALNLLPWSFVSTWQNTTAADAGRGDIQFLDNVHFHGYAICASTGNQAPQAPMAGTVGILIGQQAHLFGIAAARRSIQNEGFLGGTAITHKLSCTAKPNTNCSNGGTFNRDSLPDGLLQVPRISFGETPRLAAVTWREQ